MNPLMTNEIVGLYTRERLAAARAPRPRQRRPATRIAVGELVKLWPRRRKG